MVRILTIWLVLGSLPAFGAIRTWNSGWDVTPLAGDDIVIASGDLSWDTNLPATVASWTQGAGYTDTVTFATTYPGQGAFTNFTIIGDCILSDGTLTHAANPASETYRLSVTVGGALTVAAAASIDVDEKGRGAGGTGSPSGGDPSAYLAASHGGRSGSTGKYPAVPTYGSVTAPTNVGCGRHYGSTSYGGGAVRLIVAGSTTLEGAISARGGDKTTSWDSGASGGSIWLTTSSFTGSGSIDADGGNSTASAQCGGGGGRIAVILTGSDSFGDVDFHAYGGSSSKGYHGAAGTVYLQKQSDTAGQGELAVDNADRVPPDRLDVYTELHGQQAISITLARLTLTNAGVIGIGPDDSLDIATAAVAADASDDEDGIYLFGGTLTVPAAFTIGEYFVGIGATNSTFDPATSLTVATNGEFFVNVPHTLSTSLTVQAGGRLGHEKNTTVELHKIDLTINGNLVVDSGGQIDARGKGYNPGNGPGRGAANATAASHGGRGSPYQGGWPLDTYGSIVAPTNIGSGSYSTGDGGGAIRLTVAGGATINGLVTADGKDSAAPSFFGGASGGSVWLTTATLSGNGTMSADAGATATSGGGGGGGGRVAVTLTAGSDFGDVAMTAHGSPRTGTGNGRLHGGAGTIYLRTAGQAEAEGRLIIANTNHPVADSAATEISANVTGTAFGEVLIQTNGHLQANDSQSLMVSRVWSNGATFTGDANGTVILVDTNLMTIYGNTAFGSLLCSNVNKTIYFEAGSTTTVETALMLTGEAATNLTLRSTSTPAQWYLDVATDAGQTVQNVDVMDGNASDAVITALDSLDGGNNSNWIFAVTGETNVWTGGVSTDWGTGANWLLGRPPIPSDAATIISNTATFYPLLDNSDRNVNRLVIMTDASLGLNGHDFIANAAADIDGALVATGAETATFAGDIDFTGGLFTNAQSTVLLAGTNAQSVTSSGEGFYQLTVSNQSAVVTFADAAIATLYRNESANVVYGSDFSAAEFRVYSSAGAITQQFNAGSTYAVDNLFLLGETGSVQYLESSAAAAWNLAVSNNAYVKYVDVEYSDASGGIEICPLFSTDSSNNTNWNFGKDWRLWTGDISSDFHTPSNWVPALVPSNNSFVVVDDPDAMVLSAPASVRNIQVGGDNATTATLDAALTVGLDLVVERYGTLELNVAGMVASNDVAVYDGGVVTHRRNTSGEDYKIDLAVGGDLLIASDGAIDVDEQGRGPGGTGSPAGGDPSAYLAGSHGGRSGSTGKYPAVPTYGSIVAPTNIGSGRSYGSPSYGGGAVCLVVTGSTILDGTISARGGDKTTSWDSGASGGSVWLTTSNLSGGGSIGADGGNSTASAQCGGGGGRIAVILTGSDSFGSVGFHAYGGSSSKGHHGGAGTIYLEKQSDAAGQGELVVDNADLTPQDRLDVHTELHGQQALSFAPARLTLANAGVVGIGSDDTLDISSTALTADTSDDEEGIYVFGGTLIVPAAFSIGEFFVGIGATNSTFDPATSLTVATNGEFFVNVPHAMTADVTVDAGGRITHEKNGTVQRHAIDLAIGGSLVVATGGAVDAVGQGYNPGTGLGAGGVNATGASHGGRGSPYQGGWPLTTYGLIKTPTNIGSGSFSGGDGGGAIRLAVSGATTLDGVMAADGEDSPAPNFYCGGSGGSVWLTTATLTGSGAISADGGETATSGGGGAGGGRIAVVLTAGGDFGDVTMTAYGSERNTTGNSRLNGGAGTIYLRAAGQPLSSGLLRIVNSDTNGMADDTGYTAVLSEQADGPEDLALVATVVSNGATLTLTTSLVMRTVSIVSSNDAMDLVGAPNVLNLDSMTIDGTAYAKGGTYTTNDWNGFVTPTNVTGSGSVFIGLVGTVLFIR